MRSFAFILSLYLMVLTAIPCIDVAQDAAMHRAGVSQPVQDTHHHSEADHCSPFCTCNCCATSVIVQDHHLRLDCFSFAGKQYFPRLTSLVSEPFASIWQPPKIG